MISVVPTDMSGKAELFKHCEKTVSGQPITRRHAAATAAGPVERLEVGLAAQVELDVAELLSLDRRVNFLSSLGPARMMSAS